MGDHQVPFRRLSDRLGCERFWLAAGFALRAAFALKLGGRLYQADELGYTTVAEALAATGAFAAGGEPWVGAPLAPGFFALFFAAGTGFAGARLGQAALSIATAWLLGRLTRAATGSARAGLFALAAASLYPFFVYYSGLLMTETLYLLALVGALCLLVESLSESGAGAARAAAAGLALSLAALARTEGAPIGLALVLALGGLCALGRYRPRAWALAALCWALPLFGWAARNRALFGVYTLDLHGGVTLLHGTMFYDIDQIDTTFSQQAIELSPAYRAAAGLPPAEKDRALFRAGLRWMAEHPGDTVRQWTQKAVAFWRFYPRVDKIYPDTGGARPGLGAGRLGLVLVSLATEPLLILGGLYGLWLLRERLWTLFPLYWVVLATFGVHALVVSQMRYRLPVMPVLILAACAALDARLSRSGR